MTKKNLILGGVLIVLISAAYGYDSLLPKWREKKSQIQNFLSGVDQAAIDRIEISAKGKKTELAKSADRWKIGGTKDFYADETVAADLLAKIKSAAEADLELVSTNADKRNDFDLNEESGALVKLYSGDRQLAEFLAGKAGSDYESVYIGAPNASETYLAKADLNGVFTREDWYDRTIFASDKEKIASVRFQYPTREFTVEKKEDAWTGTLPSKFSVSQEKISKILDLMSGLEAQAVPAQSFAGTGLEKASIIIQAKGDGIDNVLMIGGPDKTDKTLYFAKRGDSDNIYQISEEQKKTLETTMAGLK